MSSILKPPTCTKAQREANVLENGELVFDVTEQAFYTGDGYTRGGAMVFPANNYTYVAYASDSSGTNFSLTPSSSLPYRAELHSIKPVNDLRVSHFSNWVRYLGNYVYTAYASDASGTNFNTIANENLMYRAEIHSEVPIYSLTASHFSSATWVKYIGDWSNIYIAYASDKNGSDFSTEPSDALPYRAILNTYTVKTNLTPADFEGCHWEKYVGDYVYTAYASNNVGDNFSLTPSTDLPFKAEIITEYKKDNLSLSDFAGATWIRYIGLDGKGINPCGLYSATAEYSINDVVRYGNSQWLCIAATTGNPPPSTSATENNAYWSLYLTDGVDGTGINFTGDYVNTQNYSVGDGVRYGDAVWICKQSATGNPPPITAKEGSNAYWNVWISDGGGFGVAADIVTDESIVNPGENAITPYFRYDDAGEIELVAKKSDGEIMAVGGLPIIPAICVYVDEENGTCAAVPVNIDENGKSTPSSVAKTNLIYTWESPNWTYNKIQVFSCSSDANAITVYVAATKP